MTDQERVDKIFDDARRAGDAITADFKAKSDALIEKHCNELHASFKKALDDAFNPIIKISAAISIVSLIILILLH